MAKLNGFGIVNFDNYDGEREVAINDDGSRQCDAIVEQLAHSKETKRALKRELPRAEKAARKEIKEGETKANMAYRTEAIKPGKTKPVGIAGFIENDQLVVEVFLKNGQVMSMHNVKDVKFSEMDADDVIERFRECLQAVVSHNMVPVWNLGADARKWPEEVVSIVATTATDFVANLESDDDISAEIFKGMLAKLTDLGIDMNMFANHLSDAFIDLTMCDGYEEFEVKCEERRVAAIEARKFELTPAFNSTIN